MEPAWGPWAVGIFWTARRLAAPAAGTVELSPKVRAFFGLFKEEEGSAEIVCVFDLAFHLLAPHLTTGAAATVGRDCCGTVFHTANRSSLANPFRKTTSGNAARLPGLRQVGLASAVGAQQQDGHDLEEPAARSQWPCGCCHAAPRAPSTESSTNRTFGRTRPKLGPGTDTRRRSDNRCLRH